MPDTAMVEASRDLAWDWEEPAENRVTDMGVVTSGGSGDRAVRGRRAPAVGHPQVPV
jgi:hypothetical protein